MVPGGAPIAIFLAIAVQADVQTAVGAVLLTAIFYFAALPVFRRLLRYFPPIVVGTMLLLVSVNLVRIYGGTITGRPGSENFADPLNVGLALATIAMTVLFAWGFTGTLRRISVMLGLVAGTALAAIFGQIDLSGVGKSASRFDTKKLANLNGHYMREADDGRLADLAAPRITALEAGFDAGRDRDLLVQAMPSLKARAKNLDELAEGALFLFRSRPLPMDEKAAKLLTDDARQLLVGAHERLLAADVWTSESLEASLKQMAEERELGLGKIAQPLRAALTGQAVSPGIFDVLVLLGREESLARIAAQTPAAAQTDTNR